MSDSTEVSKDWMEERVLALAGWCGNAAAIARKVTDRGTQS